MDADLNLETIYTSRIETIQAVRTKTRGVEFSEGATILIQTKLPKLEDVMHADDIAFHARDFRVADPQHQVRNRTEPWTVRLRRHHRSSRGEPAVTTAFYPARHPQRRSSTMAGCDPVALRFAPAAGPWPPAVCCPEAR